MISRHRATESEPLVCFESNLAYGPLHIDIETTGCVLSEKPKWKLIQVINLKDDVLSVEFPIMDKSVN